jgi:hypothetical protein
MRQVPSLHPRGGRRFTPRGGGGGGSVWLVGHGICGGGGVGSVGREREPVGRAGAEERGGVRLLEQRMMADEPVLILKDRVLVLYYHPESFDSSWRAHSGV